MLIELLQMVERYDGFGQAAQDISSVGRVFRDAYATGKIYTEDVQLLLDIGFSQTTLCEMDDVAVSGLAKALQAAYTIGRRRGAGQVYRRFGALKLAQVLLTADHKVRPTKRGRKIIEAAISKRDTQLPNYIKRIHRENDNRQEAS